MTDAQTILKMIDAVDPSDTAKLDEIDARVWCWLKGYEFVRMSYDHRGKTKLCYFRAENPKYDAGNYDCDEDGNEYRTGHSWNDGDLWWAQETKFKPRPSFSGYTRDRNALKAIRPEWWTFEIRTIGKQYDGTIWEHPSVMAKKFPETFPGYGATEELAELHAIIQAIEWERKNNAKT